MRKVTVIFGLVCLLALAACGKKDDYSISLSQEEIILYIGETHELSYTIKNNDKVVQLDVTIAVENNSVLELTNKSVKALKEGTNTVTVSLKDYPAISKTIKVVVGSSLSVSFSGPNAMFVQDNITLTAVDKADKTGLGVTWSSSNTSVATVNNGVVTGLGVGTVVITATSKTNNVAVDTTITVHERNITSLEITPLTQEVKLFDEFTLVVKVLPTNANQSVTWISSNPDIATIDENGLVKTLKAGEVSMTATSEIDNTKKATITFNVIMVNLDSLEITPLTQEINLFDEFTLVAKVLPTNAIQSVIWISSNPDIATIDEDGKVFILKDGEVTMTATSTVDDSKSATITFNAIIDPIKILTYLNVENPIKQYVTTFGYNPDQRFQWVYGSVSQYFNDKLNLVEKIVPLNENQYSGQVATPEMITAAEALKKVRPGIIHPETKYIVYHDTGNHTPGADANMHANYMVGTDNANNRARSWHYTVDENTAIHHIPDNEVSWQGDSFDAYAKSIGIETCVNFGSDLYATWQRTAKLMAKILVEQGLTVDAVKQHYDFSKKNCPQTLRMSNLYDDAVELIRAEYIVLTILKDYDISFTALNTNYVDDRGRVIKLPETATRVGYVVNISKGTYNESVVLYSTLPGLDDTTEVNLVGTPQDFEAAKNFDLQVASISKIVTEADAQSIINARSAFDILTETQKKLVTTVNLLVNKELALHKLFAVDTPVIINQIMVSDNGVTKYGYIELYNSTNSKISLKGWTLQYAQSTRTFSVDESKLNETWLVFDDDDVIKAKGYFLIQVEAGNNVGNKYLPLADRVTKIYLDLAGGKLGLTNTNQVIALSNDSHVVDFVGYGNANQHEGTASISPVANLALTRKGLIDTNYNNEDFELVNPNPRNSKLEVINPNLTIPQEHAMEVDVLINSLPKQLKLADESIIIAAREKYNLLTNEEKELVKLYGLLEEKELQIEGIKNPDLGNIYRALKSVPSQIVNDFIFPTDNGVTWSYKDGQDESYFNLTTGKYLKLSYQPKLITVIATCNDQTKEIVINFGLLKADQKAIFATGGAVPTAGGKTSDGMGTEAEQNNAIGFDGVSITVGNNVYFVGYKSFVSLSAPTSGNQLTINDLRPYGSNPDTSVPYNQSLIKGVSTNYSGTGTLYYNSSDIDLTFDPSFTYGRNNSTLYGYGKIVFSPNQDGTLTVNPFWTVFGADTNTATSGTLQTLKSGEYLWCPHIFETNVNYGTWLMQGGTGGPVGVLKPETIISITKYKTIFN